MFVLRHRLSKEMVIMSHIVECKYINNLYPFYSNPCYLWLLNLRLLLFQFHEQPEGWPPPWMTYIKIKAKKRVSWLESNCLLARRHAFCPLLYTIYCTLLSSCIVPCFKIYWKDIDDMFKKFLKSELLQKLRFICVRACF